MHSRLSNFLYLFILFYFICDTIITKNIGKEEKKKWRGDLTETIGAYERLGLLELWARAVSHQLKKRRRKVEDGKIYELFSQQGVVQRHGAKAFPCFYMYNVISVVYQKIGLLIKLFVVVVWKKCTRKLQMKRIRFSDKRSHRIKEWAETNIVHLTIVCQSYKWKTLKIVHC